MGIIEMHDGSTSQRVEIINMLVFDNYGPQCRRSRDVLFVELE